MDVWNAIYKCLQNVLTLQCKYVDLQRIVDDVIINGTPVELSEEKYELLFELQTQLELIAEHQSSHMSLSSSYSDAKIVALLDEFSAKMVKIGVEHELPPQPPPIA